MSSEIRKTENSELFDDRNRFHSSLFKSSLSDLEEKLENLQNDNDLIKVQVSSIYEKLKIYADKKRLEHARPPARISQAPKNDPVDEDEVLIPILVIGKVYFVEHFAEKRGKTII